MKKRRIAACLAVASTAVATAVVAVPNLAGAAASSAAVPNSQVSWAAHTANQGSASGTAAVNARVYLAPKGGVAAEEAAATAIATKGSGSYGKILTHAQYMSRYAPTSASVTSVEKYLTSQGLKVVSVGIDNQYVAFSGTVAAADKAFGTTIKKYKHSGQAVQAPSTVLTVPSSVSSAILSVTGLDTTAVQMTAQGVTPPAGFLNARPCSIFYGQLAATYQADYTTPLPAFNGQTLAYAPCGYTGPQLRAAYEGNTDLDGSGVTVGIVDAYMSNTLASDTNRYAATNGDGSYAPGQFVASPDSPWIHQAQCGPSGWSGEQSLDVEAVHAMAPGANIHYYGAKSCFDDDFLDTLTQTVHDDSAQLISNSWGSPSEAESSAAIAAYESVFIEGALQGQSFLFSSGDDGDELANTGVKQVDYPTSDPWVTSVGGTSTEINSGGGLHAQYGWGTYKFSLSSDGQSWVNPTFLYGAGGGQSGEFNRPAYQDGVNSSSYRTVPDVAMDADPNTGMLIGLTQTFPSGVHYDQYRIGGTSLASPLFAGITALTFEQGGTSVGLLNPTIYDHLGSFNDVKAVPTLTGDVRADFVNGLDPSNGITYSVRTFGLDSSLAVTKGYDEVTGVGTPNTGWLSVLAGPPS